MRDGRVRQICLHDSEKEGYIDGVTASFSGPLGGWLAQLTSGMR